MVEWEDAGFHCMHPDRLVLVVEYFYSADWLSYEFQDFMKLTD